MQADDIALRLLGAFYLFGGVMAARAARTSHLLDVALASITMKKLPRAEVLRTLWLAASSVVVLAGGAALMLMITTAAWLFALSALGQALYLALLAPRYFDAADPPDENGRRATKNAFVIYLVATAFVLWAYHAGRLAPWQDIMPWSAIASLAVAAFAAHLFWSLLKPLGTADKSAVADEPPPED
jgi:hypothetical protein